MGYCPSLNQLHDFDVVEHNSARAGQGSPTLISILINVIGRDKPLPLQRCTLAIEDTIWGVHPAATEVVFLKANFTLLNYLEARVSSSSPLQYLNWKCVLISTSYLSQRCVLISASVVTSEKVCVLPNFSIMSVFHFIKQNDYSEKLFRPQA